MANSTPDLNHAAEDISWANFILGPTAVFEFGCRGMHNVPSTLHGRFRKMAIMALGKCNKDGIRVAHSPKLTSRRMGRL
jgi:hypothetical protein